jgi:hypothetical protein
MEHVDNTTLSLVCEMYAKVGKIDICIQILQEGIETGLLPSEYTFAMTINACGRFLKVKEAQQVFEMYKHFYKPSEQILLEMINVYRTQSPFSQNEIELWSQKRDIIFNALYQGQGAKKGTMKSKIEKMENEEEAAILRIIHELLFQKYQAYPKYVTLAHKPTDEHNIWEMGLQISEKALEKGKEERDPLLHSVGEDRIIERAGAKSKKEAIRSIARKLKERLVHIQNPPSVVELPPTAQDPHPIKIETPHSATAVVQLVPTSPPPKNHHPTEYRRPKQKNEKAQNSAYPQKKHQAQHPSRNENSNHMKQRSQQHEQPTHHDKSPRTVQTQHPHQKKNTSPQNKKHPSTQLQKQEGPNSQSNQSNKQQTKSPQQLQHPHQNKQQRGGHPHSKSVHQQRHPQHQKAKKPSTSEEQLKKVTATLD